MLIGKPRRRITMSRTAVPQLSQNPTIPNYALDLESNVLLSTIGLYPSRPMRGIGRFPTMHMYFLLFMVGDKKLSITRGIHKSLMSFMNNGSREAGIYYFHL